jgi:prepilin-type N-terminal cleavage/methylation domain-containing protein
VTGRTGGFSLVEVLCALLILGVGLVGLVQAITVSLGTSREATRQTQAVLLAEGRLETLRAEGYLSEGEEEGEFGEEFPLFGWRQKVQKSSLDGLYEVSVEVEDTRSSETLFELKTLLFEVPFTSTLEEPAERRPAAGSSARSFNGARRGMS